MDNLDLVIICKKEEKGAAVTYKPVSTDIGIYNDDTSLFIANNGKTYPNIITGGDYVFIGRTSLKECQDMYPNKPLILLKNIYFFSVIGNKYLPAETSEKIPIILQLNRKKEQNLFLDKDLVSYYNLYYPELEIERLIKPNEMNISEVYEELSSRIIGQDNQIKQILSSIWKQYNNKDKSFNYNMLINGPEGVGKTTIFRLLEEILGIPCVIINAKRLSESGYIENAFLKLLEKTDYDIEKAAQGILVIDKLEAISANSVEQHSTINKSIQEIIINLLDEGVFTVETINNTKYRFNASNLLIIGIGNFNNNALLRKKTVGFNDTNKDNDILLSYGIIPELANKFPILIEMNELTIEDYIKIIKNSILSSININKSFLESRNIDLEISDEVIEKIAKIAYERKSGAKSINEIIESALSLASFEIADNPTLYDTLIVTSETIDNNKKYVLTKRKK